MLAGSAAGGMEPLLETAACHGEGTGKEEVEQHRQSEAESY